MILLLMLVGAAVVVGAPAATKTTDADLARRQATSVATPHVCTTTLINPTPTQAVCGASGTIGELSLLFRYRVQVNEANSPDICIDYCFGDDNGCQSFSFDYSLRICTTYFDSLADQQFVAGPSSATSNTTFYDRGCFGSNCHIRPPMPFPSNIPSSTCSGVFKETTPPDANCNAYIKSLQNPDVIGTAPFRNCPLACLNRAGCESFLFNNTALSCTLYGETIEQQGPITSSSFNPNASYIDKACVTKECTQCYPPAPTTTFAASSSSQTCVPSITTQLVQNPSFEGSSDGSPWKLSRGVTLVTDDPSNAFNGNNYIQFVSSQSSSSPSINQTLSNLNTGSEYRVQYALRHTQIDNISQCFLTVFADAQKVGQSPFRHLPDTEDTSTIYRLDYATFSPQSSVASISFELSCLRYQAPVIINFDYVQIIPAAPVCSFQLQIASSNSTHYNGLFIGSTSYFGGLQLSLVNDASSATTFGLDGFGFLVNAASTYTYLNQPNPIGSGMYYADMGNYGGFGQILCQVAADQSLQCINKIQNSNTFRWCSLCQLGEIEYQLNFVAKANPYFGVCELLDIRALFN